MIAVRRRLAVSRGSAWAPSPGSGTMRSITPRSTWSCADIFIASAAVGASSAVRQRMDAQPPGLMPECAAFLRFRTGVCARGVDEGHDRQPKPLGHLHDPHGLAVALGVRHAEVATDVLVGVGALLLTVEHDPPAVDAREARDHRGIVAEPPVAVQLD